MPLMRWYVLYCKRGYNYHDRLKPLADQVFDPVYIHVTKRGNSLLSKVKNLCPGYTFIKSDLSAFSSIIEVPGVIRFLSFGSRLYEAPEQLISSLKDISVKTDVPELKTEIERISQAKTKEEREIQFINFLKNHQEPSFDRKIE